jgi:DNA processing protein
VSHLCEQCARRSWLLAELSVPLDFRAGDLARLWPLLELSDAELIQALGGRRRADLHAAYAAWEAPPARDGGDVESVCRHHFAYPSSLRENALAPHTLEVRGGLERLTTMLKEPVVAIVGTRRASDYGVETARGLARGLAACGVTVASGLAEGIPTAVHAGALEAGGRTLTVMAAGVERCTPAACRGLYGRLLESGCAISELQGHRSGRARRWWLPARARTLALLAQLVIVVEAEEHPWELCCAQLAAAHGRQVAAVPGRVSSVASQGTNALLVNGARLIRGPQDALDLLYGAGAREAPEPSAQPARLEARLQRMLERVGAGEDTAAKLTRQGAQAADVTLALAELELQGLLVRGDAGRYLPPAGASAR